MAAAVVYEGVRNTAGDTGRLFEGQSFWFSSAVPQRKWLIENATANGATIVSLEKQADVLIVDHARKNAPVGTHSYKYIEQSIRNGRLENLADHIVGPSKSTDRPVGSMTTAPKGSRSKYTEAEDQLLWNFIKPYENAGGTTGGNEIYKQLEDAHGNGRHTYQSWRDRWLKHVRFQKRRITQIVYAGDDEEGDTTATQKLAQSSPTRQATVTTESSAQIQRKAPGAAGLQAASSSQTLPQDEVSGTEDMATFHARQALQRKLGRLLPSSPSSLNARHWQPAPVSQRPQDQARTEAVRVQRQQAGLGTNIPVVEDVPEQVSEQPSQSAAAKEEADLPPQNSQGSVENFTDEEYRLLMGSADYIIRVGEGLQDDSWEKMAENYPNHSARSWREFWEGKVKPDYEKQLLRIKIEQGSQEVEGEEEVIVVVQDEVAREENGEKGTAQASTQATEPEGRREKLEKIVAATGRIPSRMSVLNKNAPEPSSDEEFEPPHLENDEAPDEPREADEEPETIEDFEKAGANEDGLHSLFESQVSEPSQNASPWVCRWSECGTELLNLYELVKHVAGTHRPNPEEVADEHGWACHWSECRKTRVDEYGNEVALNLQSRQDWVSHYIDEHIKPISAQYGLGFSMGQTQDARPEASRALQRVVQQDEDESTHGIQHPTASPERRSKAAQIDRAWEEGEAEEYKEEDGEESDEAEETESTSSSGLEREKEIMDLSSNEDDDDDDRSFSPRRSKRLRNIPREPHVKDQGFSYVDKAVGSSPPLPALKTSAEGINSPTLQPLSPTASKPPEPNEARKRSPGKGNSQNSNLNTSHVQEVVEMHHEEIFDTSSAMSSPRKRPREPQSGNRRKESPELPARADFDRKTKRRKERHHEDEQLEIPSTPEHRIVLGELEDDDNDGSMLNGSPTPRPRSRNARGGKSLSGTPTRRNDFQAEGTEHTSPLHISMLGDPDVEITPSSPARSTSTRPDDLSSEPDLAFETAPQTISNLWGTAPSEEREEEATEHGVQYDTAPEPKGKGRARLDTQDLFAQSISNLRAEEEDPFALPEPEGGWPDDLSEEDVLGGPLSELPIPTSYQPQQADEADDDDDDEDEDASSIPADVPGWVAERTAEDESLDVEILLRAINATSGFNQKLIIDVHDFIVSKQRRGELETLPVYMKGCWTEQDDRGLYSHNRHERERILKKHGRVGVERREKWLKEEI